MHEGPAIDVAESPLTWAQPAIMRLGYRQWQLPSHDFLVHEWVPPEHREFIDSIFIGTDTLRPPFMDAAFMDAVKTMEAGMVVAQSFPEPPACRGPRRQRLVPQFANS